MTRAITPCTATPRQLAELVGGQEPALWEEHDWDAFVGEFERAGYGDTPTEDIPESVWLEALEWSRRAGWPT